MKLARTLANIVGPMLLVQVILGGSATLLSFPILIHIIWGTLTFAVLIAATVIAARSFGRSSSVFKVGIAAILDFILQGTLGFVAFGSDTVVVIHLTNAFILGALVTYLIAFADRADKALASNMGMTGQA